MSIRPSSMFGGNAQLKQFFLTEVTFAVDLQVDVLVDSDPVPLERLAPLDGSLEVLYGLVGGGVPLLGYLE